MSQQSNTRDESAISNGQKTRFAAIANSETVHIHERQSDGSIYCVCMIEPADVDAWIKQLWVAKQAATNGGDRE